MHPRPFYRWKSFWFGVLFLAFLGWSSWDSRRNATTLSDWGWALVRSESQTIFLHRPRTLFFGGGYQRRFDSIGWDKETAFWGDRGAFSVCIPDYVLGSILFLPWLGWLAWRWRKQKRAHGVTVP